MIYCKECGTEVSEKAKACPKCGCPTNDSSNEIKVILNKSVIKKIVVCAVIVFLSIFIGKGFIHPNLKFDNLVFKTSKVKNLLGYWNNFDDRSNTYCWDDCIKLYDIPVKYVIYDKDNGGWYYFYFEDCYMDDVYEIIGRHGYATYIKGLYKVDHERLALWVEGIEEIGEYKGLFLIKVTESL